MLTLRDSFRCPRLKVIDTKSGRLLTWAEARALVRAPSVAAGDRADLTALT